MKEKLKEVKGDLRRRMHQPISEQGIWLRQVVTGFFGYHAVPTNFRALGAFRLHIAHLWRRVLRRRSQKDGSTWNGSTSWPTNGSRNRASFILGPAFVLPSNTPGGSRMREIRPYGSVRGAPSNGCPYRDPEFVKNLARPVHHKYPLWPVKFATSNARWCTNKGRPAC